MPRKEFIQRAKAICAASKRRLGESSASYLKRRSQETHEPYGAVGAVEAVPRLIVPYLRRTSRELVDIGLPEGHAYEAEALWQTLENILRRVEDEGMYAWRSATLLPPFRNHAKPFGLQNCVLN